MNEIQDLRQSILMQVTATVEEKAAELCADAADYIDHVFSGGNPGENPSGKLWTYHVPLSEYALQITNAYRDSLDLPESPYHPWSAAYVIFDFMTRPLGHWHTSADLRKLINNSQVESTLQPYRLRHAGYELEKRKMMDGKTAYRLVSVEVR